MERDSFIFYRSFLEAIKCMPSEVQAEIYPAIVEYALNGKEPKGLSDIAKGVFILIKPVMDANNARSEGGKKGKKKSLSYLLSFLTDSLSSLSHEAPSPPDSSPSPQHL